MVKSTTLPPEQKSPKPYVPGSLNPTTFPTRDVSGPGISHRPSVGSIDFFTEAGKSLKQTIYNADIKPVSETLKAEVMYSTLKILDAESLVSLPSHVYSFLYTKYNGTANMSIQEGTIGQPQILEVRASIDYHDTFCAVPSVHLGTEQTSLDYTSADMIRASSLPRFYDVITTSSKPKPGDIITVQYTDSNPRTSGIIVSHVGSQSSGVSAGVGSASSYVAGAYADLVPSDISLSGESAQGWVSVPADQYLSQDNGKPFGKTSLKLRKDVAASYKKLYDEVHRLGGILTSAGSQRGLTEGKGNNRNKAEFSHHKLGRAFDMSPYSCFWHHRAKKKGTYYPYLAESAVMQNGKHAPDKIVNKRQKWNIWCVVPKEHSAYEGTKERKLIVWRPKGTAGKIQNLISEEVTVRAFNFTALAAKYGFTGIFSREHTMRGAEFGGMEWWHFQSNVGLVKRQTSFLDEVLRLLGPKAAARQGMTRSVAELFARTYYTSNTWRTHKVRKPTPSAKKTPASLPKPKSAMSVASENASETTSSEPANMSVQDDE